MEMTDFEQGVFKAVGRVTSGVTDPEDWLIDAVNGGTSKTGVRVTTASALGLPTVWSAISRIAGHLGLLPLECRRRTGGEDSEIDRLNPAHKVLNRRPNELQTPMTFRETMSAHALLRGNGCAWINRDQAGRPIELLILPQENTTICLLDGEKWFLVNIPKDYPRPDTDRSGTYYKIPDQDVFHLPGLSWNGIYGLDLLSVARDVFALDEAGRDTTSYSFKNNGRPGLLLEAGPQQLRTAKEAREFIDNFNSAHTGIDASGRTGLIRDGMKAHVLPISATDAQHLENRKFSQDDIAMLFGLEHAYGSNSVYKDLAQRQTAYVQNTLSRWTQRWEEESFRKLLVQRQRDRDTHFFRYNMSEILRGDLNNLASYTASLRQQGAISGNDVRRIHQMNAVDGLDDYTNPNVATDDGIQENDTEEPQQDEQTTEQDEPTAELLRRAQLRHAVGVQSVESRNVVKLAERAASPSEFVNDVGEFYSGFAATVSEMQTDIGLDDTSADYVRAATGRLVDALKAAPETNLVDIAEGLFSSDPKIRAKELI